MAQCCWWWQCSAQALLLSYSGKCQERSLLASESVTQDIIHTEVHMLHLNSDSNIKLLLGLMGLLELSDFRITFFDVCGWNIVCPSLHVCKKTYCSRLCHLCICSIEYGICLYAFFQLLLKIRKRKEISFRPGPPVAEYLGNLVHFYTFKPDIHTRPQFLSLKMTFPENCSHWLWISGAVCPPFNVKLLSVFTCVLVVYPLTFCSCFGEMFIIRSLCWNIFIRLHASPLFHVKVY